jgi:hypothetical protein
MDGHLDTDNFTLGRGAIVAVKGTGKGLDITADAEIETERITLFGTTYRMKDRLFHVKGKISGKLAQDLSLALSGDVEDVGPGKLGISGNVTGDNGRIVVKGSIDLNRLQVVQAEKGSRLSGRIRGNVTTSWDKEVSVDGTLVCRQCRHFRLGHLPDGRWPLTMAGERISGRKTMGEETT